MFCWKSEFSKKALKRQKSYTSGFKIGVNSCAQEIGNQAAVIELEMDERWIHRWRGEKADTEIMPLQKDLEEVVL